MTGRAIVRMAKLALIFRQVNGGNSSSAYVRIARLYLLPIDKVFDLLSMETFLVIVVVVVALFIVFKVFKTLLKWLLIVVVVIAAIAFFSNPDFDDHRDKLSSIRKELSHDIKEKKVQFDDYKIFSLTKKKVNGEEKIVGVGAFGKVWHFDEE